MCYSRSVSQSMAMLRTPALVTFVLLLSAPLWAEPPHRLGLGGLGDLVTVFSGDAERGITALSPAGDVDGDGLEDVLFRFSWSAGAPASQDDVVLLYGFDTPGGEFDVPSSETRKTVIETGLTERRVGSSDLSAWAVGGGLDVNGDRRPDVLVGSSFEIGLDGEGGPAILVIFGGVLPERIDRGSVGIGVPGSRFVQGDAILEHLGVVADLLDDLNGDGLAEVGIVIPGGLSRVPALYVVFGSEGLPPVVDLSQTGKDVPGFVFVGAPDSWFFHKVSALGDIDGDGLSEVGICGRPSDGGELFCQLFFGAAEFPPLVEHGKVPAAAGIRFDGISEIAGAGDTDGDGRDDLVLDDGRSSTSVTDGEAYLVFGRPRSELPRTVDPESLVSLNRVHTLIQRVQHGLGLGESAQGFGFGRGRDIDADGKSEILLSTSIKHFLADPVAAGWSGGITVIRGGSDLPRRVTTEQVAEEFGVVIDGTDPQGRAGRRVFAIPDFNGDGVGDLLVASLFDPRCEHPGTATDYKVWLVSGEVLDPEIKPRVSVVHPPHGPMQGGTTSLVMGAGFDEETRILVGENEAEIEDVISSGLLTVKIPAAPQPGDVELTAMGVGGAGETSVTYRYSVGRTIEVGPAGDRSVALSREVPESYTLRGASFAGDVNGDGRTDIGLVEIDAAGSYLTLVFGGTGREDVSLDELELPAGVRLFGAHETERVVGLAAGGDVNGDGYDDLLVKTFIPGEGNQWRLVPGRPEWPTAVAIREIEANVRIFSENPELSPEAFAVVPDVDGDSLSDMILTLSERARTVIFILTGSEAFPDEVSLESAADAGEAAHLVVDLSLYSTTGHAGDFDGNGVPDVFFGGTGRFLDGAVAVLYMSPFLFSGRTIELTSDLFGDNAGLLVAGSDITRGFEFMAAVPGDMNGDGFPELFMRQDDSESCTWSPRAGEGVFADYEAILANAGRFSDSVRSFYAGTSVGVPDFVPGEPGTQEGVLTARGGANGEGLGMEATGAGDFNGDGFLDMLLGAPGVLFETGGARKAYIVLGSDDFYLDSLNELSAPSERVIQLIGGDVPAFGRFVSGGVDWDGDGRDDVLIGGRDGRAFVVFGSGGSRTFIRGDSNLDGVINIADAVLTLAYLFQGGLTLSCLDAADADDDGTVIITDAVYALAFLFGGGPPPPMPHPLRGEDPTADQLECRD